MVNLRASSALASAVTSAANARTITQSFVGEKAPSRSRKRVKAEQTDTITSVEEASPVKKSKKVAIKSESATVKEEENLPFLSREEVTKCTTIMYPKLPFHLPDAIQHLRNVDIRFHGLLDAIELTPFKELEDGQVKELDLFKTLTSSVLGQQISWLAARAILYRFIRLFFPDLPEKPDFTLTPREALPFPHPIDVIECKEESLRGAGLSGAKVKYIQDIARRASDGRLDVRKIIEMQEQECIYELSRIRGVGKWTAEMLLIFALRRADILPVGDLGIQKGMVLFYLADKEGPSISKKKKAKTVKGELLDSNHADNEPIPVIETHLGQPQVEVEETIADLPPTLTGPKIEATNEDSSMLETMQPLPDIISLSTLKSRGDGKKAKGNVYLTPAEMELLAAPWAPYRSVASFLMWAIESK